MQTYKLTHSSSGSDHSLAPLMARIRDLGRHLWERLSSTDQIRVWQSQDRQGQTYWNAYDPATNRQVTVTSQEELIAWIERSEPMGEIWPSQTAASTFLYPLSNRFPPDQ